MFQTTKYFNMFPYGMEWFDHGGSYIFFVDLLLLAALAAADRSSGQAVPASLRNHRTTRP